MSYAARQELAEPDRVERLEKVEVAVAPNLAESDGMTLCSLVPSHSVGRSDKSGGVHCGHTKCNVRTLDRMSGGIEAGGCRSVARDTDARPLLAPLVLVEPL